MRVIRLRFNKRREQRLILLMNLINRLQLLPLIGLRKHITRPFITLLNNITQHWRLLPIIVIIIMRRFDTFLWTFYCHVHSLWVSYADLWLSNLVFWLERFLVIVCLRLLYHHWFYEELLGRCWLVWGVFLFDL